jgi:tRNA(fMet)-specific endonuclease VapC
VAVAIGEGYATLRVWLRVRVSRDRRRRADASVIVYGVEKRRSPALAARVRELIGSAGLILPFDEIAGQRYGQLRAALDSEGRRLAEPDLRIAAIALTRDATLVTANTRHFARIADLRLENWLLDDGR